MIGEVFTYMFLFCALYLEVFLLMNFLEMRENMRKVVDFKLPQKLPSVAVIVPCWNEETTIVKTIFSLLKLDYPKNLLSIVIVDDGSTDKTWNVLQRFAKNKQVKLYRKENGGKHTAVNFGISVSESDLVGCLDADSYVHPQTLNRIVAGFNDKEVMAVTPSVKVNEPKNWLELIQKVEYGMGIFIRRTLSHLNALYITPGPFSIFRREVFAKIGDYRRAYNTEDLEIALRMQKNRMKIVNIHNAFVYTTSPKTLRALYKQRIRWTYGFMKNALDYRSMFFNPNYGNLGMIIFPAAGFSIASSLYFFGKTVLDFISSIILKVQEYMTVGFYWKAPNFSLDFFYLDTGVILFVSIVAVIGTIFIIVFSRALAQENDEKVRPGLDVALFLAIYAVIAPIWMARALFNVVFARGTKWR